MKDDFTTRRLLDQAIRGKDILDARRKFKKGKQIKVLKRELLSDDLRKEEYVVTNDKLPYIIEISNLKLLKRERERGATKERLNELKRLHTTTITNTQLVMYVRAGKAGVVLE